MLVSFVTIQRTANTQNRGFKGIFEFSESFVKLGKASVQMSRSIIQFVRDQIFSFQISLKMAESIFEVQNAIKKF